MALSNGVSPEFTQVNTGLQKATERNTNWAGGATWDLDLQGTALRYLLL